MCCTAWEGRGKLWPLSLLSLSLSLHFFFLFLHNKSCELFLPNLSIIVRCFFSYGGSLLGFFSSILLVLDLPYLSFFVTCHSCHYQLAARSTTDLTIFWK
ncbi:hypothetical protein LOK49_LG06G01191 [Camellia lanceoleosa]|uniref:Uncharacterized protein n=1 Tax=Camellia lanceoleosa TaxID=1840588 RepID=A0ACC0HIT4_9ERIC|nr:hypothetical protein LOK49_LG06G01191 [Camellia lanceoleosa]